MRRFEFFLVLGSPFLSISKYMKKGWYLSKNLDMNMLSASRQPINIQISFLFVRDGIYRIARIFSWLAYMPHVNLWYPRNLLEASLKEHLRGFICMSCLRSLVKIVCRWSKWLVFLQLDYYVVNVYLNYHTDVVFEYSVHHLLVGYNGILELKRNHLVPIQATICNVRKCEFDQVHTEVFDDILKMHSRKIVFGSLKLRPLNR